MSKLEQAKQYVRDNVKIETISPPVKGGQSCGVLYCKKKTNQRTN